MSKPKITRFNAANGIRNTASPERLSTSDLTVAKDVDIDVTGELSRRKGVVRINATPTHSLFSHAGTGYMVQNGVMKSFTPDGVATTLFAGITGSRVSYAESNNRIYWSDGLLAGVIQDGQVRPWGVPPPPIPALTATTGSLQAGLYGLAVTYVRDDGHESGARETVRVAVPDNSGVVVSLTQSLTPSVVAQRVYMTAPDGAALHLVGEYPNTTGTATIVAASDSGRVLSTQFFVPPPVGQLVAFFAGSMFVARDNFLFYTPAYEPELCDIRFAYVPFEERITMIAPVTNGIFLGTTASVFFLQGMAPAEFGVAKVYEKGAIEGTAITTRGDYMVKDAQPDPCATWLSQDGVCVGLAVGQSNNLTGQVKNLTEERYEHSTSSQAGASVLKLRNGTPHFVVSTF